jgi:hypothetical protein
LQQNTAKTGICRPDLLSHFPFPTFSKMGNQGSGTGNTTTRRLQQQAGRW